MSRTLVVSDTFTEASNVNITSHTPDLGTSYVMLGGVGTLLIDAALDKLVDNNASNGNRAIEQTAISTTDMDVECSFERRTSDNSFPGLIARYDGTDRVEATFDTSIGTNGSYRLFNSETAEVFLYALTAPEAWAIASGDVRRMRLSVRGTIAELFIDGVSKVFGTAPNNVTGTKAGLLLGNFSGVAQALQAEDFAVYEVTTSTQSVSGASANSGDVAFTISINGLTGASTNSGSVATVLIPFGGGGPTTYQQSVGGTSTNSGALFTVKNPAAGGSGFPMRFLQPRTE